MRQLPEWARWAEEMAFITDIFSHAAQAHEHLSEVCANISALTKVTDKATLLSVINGAVCPLIQVNVPEGFLNPVEEKKAKTTGRGEERENLKDGAACPQCHLFETRASKWSDPHLNCCSLVKDVQKIL